jgi:hypothetical protein
MGRVHPERWFPWRALSEGRVGGEGDNQGRRRKGALGGGGRPETLERRDSGRRMEGVGLFFRVVRP